MTVSTIPPGKIIFIIYFFPDTAYDLKGFTMDNDILYAVVEQSYVSITSNTDLAQVKTFLTLNDFENN
jgi:hypothetical protein